MENKSILEGMPTGEYWHGENKAGIVRAITIYSEICDRFKKDKNYGDDFVRNNQSLMGQLTVAAIQAMEK